MPTIVTRRARAAPAISTAEVRRLGDAMLAQLELGAAELSVLLTDDATITELNRQHRDKDSPTDVLAFPLDERESVGSPLRLLGDVVISLHTAERQARGRRRELLEEVRFLLAHGILHLVGYDHAAPEEKREMTRMTRRLVAGAALRMPPRPARKPRKTAPAVTRDRRPSKKKRIRSR